MRPAPSNALNIEGVLHRWASSTDDAPARPVPEFIIPTSQELVDPKAQTARIGDKPKRCNCKHSQCIKLYCECFRFEQFCRDCSCEGCHNQEESTLRRNIISMIKQKSKTSFRLKGTGIESGRKALVWEDFEGEFTDSVRGCNCRKSNCKKKYCECFQSFRGCTTSCKCLECLNVRTEDEGGLGKRAESESDREREGLRRSLLERLLELRKLSVRKSQN